MRVDQARQHDHAARVNNAVGCFRQLGGGASLYNRVVTDEQPAVWDAPLPGIHCDEQIGVSEEKGRHRWLLTRIVTDHWSLVTGHWPLVTGH